MSIDARVALPLVAATSWWNSSSNWTSSSWEPAADEADVLRGWLENRFRVLQAALA